MTVTANTDPVDLAVGDHTVRDSPTVIGLDTEERPVRNRVSLVVPARNEARNLALVLESIPDCIDDVVLVDGNSRDATVAMAVHCRPDVRVVSQGAPGKERPFEPDSKLPPGTSS